MKKIFLITFIIVISFTLFLRNSSNKVNILQLTKENYSLYIKDINIGYETFHFKEKRTNNLYIEVKRNYKIIPLKKHTDLLILKTIDFEIKEQKDQTSFCNIGTTVFFEKEKKCLIKKN